MKKPVVIMLHAVTTSFLAVSPVVLMGAEEKAPSNPEAAGSNPGAGHSAGLPEGTKEAVVAGPATEPKISELVKNAVEAAPAAAKTAGVKFYGHKTATILGNNLIYFDLGSGRPKEDEFADNALVLQAGANYAYDEHFNFGIAIGRSQQDLRIPVLVNVPYYSYNTYRSRYYTYRVPVVRSRQELRLYDAELETTSGSLSFAYGLNPGEAINPYFGAGLYYVDSSLSVSGEESASESDTGYSVGVGAEIKLSDAVGFIPSYSHSEAGEFEANFLSGLLTVWTADRFGFRLGLNKETESDSITISGGIMAAF